VPQIPAGGYLSQRLYDTAVTMFTESKCLCAQLYRKTSEDGQDDGIIAVEDRQDVKDMGGRGSDVTFYYGDRRRGQDLAPKALGATAYGQSSPQRPLYKQTLNMQAQELATTGFFALEVGQTYTNVPLETKELQNCGAESAELICRSIYYHLAGLTAYNPTGSLWPVAPCGNTVTELDAAHRFWMGGETTDAGVAGNTSAILTMEALELIITRLQSRANGVLSPMVPAQTPWGEWFVFICDAEGVEQLNRHSSTNRFTSLTLSEIQGGNDIDKVASFMKANSGFQGTRRILVLLDDYTPFGQSGSTSGQATAGTQIGHVRRGMLLGRLGMKLIWGQGFDAESSHIRATSHQVHLQQDWKFFTHWGGVACIPSDAPTPQRMGSATVAYYVNAATPTN
jgi:hypothetical protein